MSGMVSAEEQRIDPDFGSKVMATADGSDDREMRRERL